MMRRTRPTRHDRGIALLLVLIAMTTATTLTIGWLASQDNATLIGRNVVEAAQARSLANSGLDLAVSVMQTETSWRTAHSNGILLSNYPHGQGTIDVTLLDVATNLPPTPESSEFLVTSIAKFDNLSQSVSAYVSLLENGEGDLESDVSGFALFALATIEMQDNASVGRWAEAPASALGRRIAMGTASSSSRSVQVRGNAMAIDATIYHGKNSSPALLINSTPLAIETVPVPWTMELDGEVEAVTPSKTRSPPGRRRGFSASSDSEGDAPGTLRLARNEVMHLEPGTPLVVNGDLVLEEGAKLIVHGESSLLVDGQLLMDDSSIHLLDGARLNATVNGGAHLEDARIGNGTPWMDPERVEFTSTSTDSQADPWSIGGESQVTGLIEGSRIDVTIEDQGIVRGRIAANSINMCNNAQLLYDHGLGNGLDQPRAASMLDCMQERGSRVQSFMDSLPGRFIDDLLGMDNDRSNRLDRRERRRNRQRWLDASRNMDWRSGPTPRPIPIECRLVAHGLNHEQWEDYVIARMEIRP